MSSKRNRWERSSFLEEGGVSVARFYGNEDRGVAFIYDVYPEGEVSALSYWYDKGELTNIPDKPFVNALLSKKLSAKERNDLSWSFLKDKYDELFKEKH